MKKRQKVIVLGLATSSLGLLGTGKLVRMVTGEPPKKARAADARVAGAGAFVGAEWDLPVTRNERVDFFMDYLAGEKYEEMSTWLERLGKYGPMLQEKLRERGMPDDLIYLAMIESGLDPEAYSAAHAVGVWQFVAETGQRYGLEVSRYVDERRDPVKATDAALDYLQDLYDHFGSWYLAAAAYNTGENRVERILRERAGGAKGDDALYWRISSFIPAETRDYVPLMLAAGHIGKDPVRYGFTNIRYEAPLAYAEVRVAPGTPLAEVARDAGVSVDSVRELNPHLIRDTTPPDRAWDVRIPA